MLIKIITIVAIASFTTAEFNIEDALVGALKSINTIEDTISDNDTALPIIEDEAGDSNTKLAETEHVFQEDDSSLSNPEQAKENLGDVVKKALADIKTYIETAKELWRQWVKNYGCSNSSIFGHCKTNQTISKSPRPWKKSVGKAGVPTDPPTQLKGHVTGASFHMKNSLEEGLRNWYKTLPKIAKEDVTGKDDGNQ